MLDVVLFTRSVVSSSLWPHGPQHARLPSHHERPKLAQTCPLNKWCHPTISSSVILFSSCLRSFPASGSFPTSQLFASGGHSIGASALASVPPMNIQDWFPLGFTDLISLQSKGLSRVFLSYNNKRWNLSTCPSIGKFINKIYLYYGFTVQKVIESTGLGRSQKANAKKSKLKEDVMIAL